MANHQSSLDLFTMLFIRLPFMADTEDNRDLISAFSLEVMHELEPCFRINEGNTLVQSKIGDEEYYSMAQLTLVADLVACYILMVHMAAVSGGIDTMGGSTPVLIATNKALTKTVAGSVEAEWKIIDIKEGAGMYTNGAKLLDFYKASAIRRARTLKCALDICEDCTTSVELMLYKEAHNFIVRTSC